MEEREEEMVGHGKRRGAILLLCFSFVGTKKRKGMGNGWLEDGCDYGA